MKDKIDLLKTKLSQEVREGRKMERALENYYNKIENLSTLIKGSKIVAGITGAIGGISGFLFASTDDYHTEFQTGVDLFKENPEWFVSALVCLGFAGATAWIASKLEDKRYDTMLDYDETEDQLDATQERVDGLVDELEKHNIRPKFRTTFNKPYQDEEVIEEEEDIADATPVDSHPNVIPIEKSDKYRPQFKGDDHNNFFPDDLNQ